MSTRIHIVSLTDAGFSLGQQLQTLLDSDSSHSHCPKPFAACVQGAFRRGERLILICATGIAVRTLAPVLASKHCDPPVLVMDEQGAFVIPLLSGHEGGANAWGEQVASQLGAQLVLTTAHPYLQPLYTVGMGCERGCPREHLQALLEQCLAQAQLAVTQIASLNSITLKADEQGLIELADQLTLPYHTWSAAELRSVEPLLNSRSDYLFRTVGVYGVAESAALYAAQQAAQDPPELLLCKQKTARATCAIARAYPPAQRG